MANKMGKKELSMEDIKRIITANERFKKIDLMGGEPLLYSHINELVDYLKENNKDVSLYTNGVLLNTVSDNLMPLRVCISFHELESDDASRKPLFKIADKIDNFYLSHKDNKIKLIFLLDKKNYLNAVDYIKKVENRFPWLNKLTIGLMRNEDDYWNDAAHGVLSFGEYANTIQSILNEYNGRLNLDIFLKGVLTFGLPEENMIYENRTNRFKCVFSDMSYSECLFNAHLKTQQYLDGNCELPLCSETCQHTGKKKCIADKVRLRNRGNYDNRK